MKIVLQWVGKTRNPHLHSLIQDYQKRLAHFCHLTIKEVAGAKDGDSARIIFLESDAMLKKLSRPDFVILLDSRGKSLTTREFAALLRTHRDTSPHSLVFLIGGHEGVSQQVKDRANQTLSLSPMTLTHEFVRVLLLEQIYRAFSILNGLPYHK